MSRFLAAKHLGSLRPVDDAGRSHADRPRRNGHDRNEAPAKPEAPSHVLALMTLVWQNIDGDAIRPSKTRLPQSRSRRASHASSCRTVRSVSFPAASRSTGWTRRSSPRLERVCDLIARYFMPGVTSDDLKREVALMIGLREAA